MSGPRGGARQARAEPACSSSAPRAASTLVTRSRFVGSSHPESGDCCAASRPARDRRACGNGRSGTAPQRAVGDKGDPSSRVVGSSSSLGIARPERILGLQRGNRMDGVRAADGVRAPLRTARDTAPSRRRPARPSHRRSLRSASCRIDAVLVVEIDHIHAEPLQRRVARLAHVFGAAVDAEERAVGSRTLPNFVASTTWSRRSRMARPTSR